MAQHQEDKVSLWQLQQALEMPLVEVWLGLLHSPQPYQWEGQGEFYREARSQADTEQGMVAIHHVLALLPHP